MLAYKIFGLQPGFADGLLFYSCVEDLQNHPDLWLDECPYLEPHLSPQVQARLRVELVQAEVAASPTIVRRPPPPQQPTSLSA